MIALAITLLITAHKGADTISVFSRGHLGRTATKEGKRQGAKSQKPTAPGIPRRSPIQALTRPDPAWLPRSDQIGRVQGGMAVGASGGLWLPQEAGPSTPARRQASPPPRGRVAGVGNPRGAHPLPPAAWLGCSPGLRPSSAPPPGCALLRPPNASRFPLSSSARRPGS